MSGLSLCKVRRHQLTKQIRRLSLIYLKATKICPILEGATEQVGVRDTASSMTQTSKMCFQDYGHPNTPFVPSIQHCETAVIHQPIARWNVSDTLNLAIVIKGATRSNIEKSEIETLLFVS